MIARLLHLAGIPSLQSEAVVPIKVVNRAMPVFPQQFYAVSVPENQHSNVPVLTVQAESPKGRQLIYTIIQGNNNEEFAVDFNTGKPANDLFGKNNFWKEMRCVFSSSRNFNTSVNVKTKREQLKN